eukprot:TRINITY_DN11346_c0_g1_i1.p1 TRINITY_DN11346_c0_g1~~TRINITY_DN11346_c0_g1_i1.p1  ORF type:complete len:382 (+),score=58.32 TRINITY_DN11346_c0_g1_i1:68-1213(+)
MAYRARGSTAEGFARALVEAGTIEPKHEAAFAAIDRAFFYPQADDHEGPSMVYFDTPIRIGKKHQSAPHIYGNALSVLDLKPGHSFLNVGSGTGYFSALVGYITGLKGLNHGIELEHGNVAFARKALAELFSDRGLFVPITFQAGSVFDLDVEANVTYDRIYIGCGFDADKIPFFQQMLNDGGVLFGPFDFGEPRPGLHQVLVRIVRKGASYDLSHLSPARFAPGSPEHGIGSKFVLCPRIGWTADTHHMYPTAFRRVALLLLFCVRKTELCDDLVLPVMGFVPPSWTPLLDRSSSPPLPLDAFRIGVAVLVSGLVRNPELNGLRGLVVALGAGDRRNRVGVDLGPEWGRKALRTGNLSLCEPGARRDSVDGDGDVVVQGP